MRGIDPARLPSRVKHTLVATTQLSEIDIGAVGVVEESREADAQRSQEMSPEQE